MSIESTPPQEHFTREQIFGILNRIAFPLSHLPPNTLPEPTLATLQELQTRLVTTIPFETLALRTTVSRGVDISIEGIYDRVVVQKRGGWCFSLNRLAYELLLGLGFRTQFTIARVCKPLKPTDPIRFSAKTHRVSIVRFFDEATGSDTKYLFDIGFGNSAQLPLQLKEGATIEYGGHIRRMTTRTHIQAEPEILGNPPFVMWSIEEYLPADDTWTPWYAFSEQQFYENDCQVANFYTNYSPTSTFFKAFWCIRSTLEGEYYLLIDKKFLIKNAKGLVKQIDFLTEQDRLDVLKEYFDIVLTDEELKHHDSWIVPVEPVAEAVPAVDASVESITSLDAATLV
ncbi:N-terminal acetyltransferase [Linnemannia elongata]|uniref:Cysteine proteinase n=1 Tax=Linnemannia elongata AG-77 TaxID=1314771 RepID=A0A197JSP3_9FUNG|nr:N-terminal acetyltransferase [Linnemannia elongata]OAQ27339.1 cysteine proteinase [Linnemannia elongata AG-77]